jgi:hypothetical protein
MLGTENGGTATDFVSCFLGKKLDILRNNVMEVTNRFDILSTDRGFGRHCHYIGETGKGTLLGES